MNDERLELAANGWEPSPVWPLILLGSLGILVTTTVVAALFWPPLIGVTLLGVFGIPVLLAPMLMQGPVIRVTREGIAFGWPDGRRHAPGGIVVLAGEPGLKTELWYGGELLQDAEWSFDRGSELAQRIAEIVGGTLDDRRDAALWHRFETDPIFRETVLFDRAVAASRLRFPAVHAIEPAQPHSDGDAGSVAYRLRESGGLGTPIAIDARGVRSETGGPVPLETLLDCALVAKEGQYRPDVRVVARRADGLIVVVAVADAHREQVAELAWLAAEIRRLAEVKRQQDRGERSDIPRSLGALRSAE
ncbi:MAG: hypothetical protein H6737_05405 [Alphaproteobacteria bacterium]|nr:hypothetical protein [Alphaproteobacteria bacterium]